MACIGLVQQLFFLNAANCRGLRASGTGLEMHRKQKPSSMSSCLLDLRLIGSRGQIELRQCQAGETNKEQWEILVRTVVLGRWVGHDKPKSIS